MPPTKKPPEDYMKLISVHFPKKALAIIDKLVQLQLFPNRAEFLRFAATSQIIDLKIILRDEL